MVNNVKHYIIDGNNLIGKSSQLSQLQKKDKHTVREKLLQIIERHFAGRKIKITLHYDGFEGTPIKSSFVKIIYSEKKTADDLIKEQIGKLSNRRSITVISSDNSILQFSRACSCDIMPADKFLNLILNKNQADEEEARIEEIRNNAEFKKLFGAN